MAFIKELCFALLACTLVQAVPAPAREGPSVSFKVPDLRGDGVSVTVGVNRFIPSISISKESALKKEILPAPSTQAPIQLIALPDPAVEATATEAISGTSQSPTIPEAKPACILC